MLPGAMQKKAAADLSSLGETRSTFLALCTMKVLLDEAQSQAKSFQYTD